MEIEFLPPEKKLKRVVNEKGELDIAESRKMFWEPYDTMLQEFEAAGKIEIANTIDLALRALALGYGYEFSYSTIKSKNFTKKQEEKILDVIFKFSAFGDFFRKWVMREMKNQVVPLWAHQARAIEAALKVTSYPLFHEPGVGKTRTIIEILLRRWTVDGERKIKKTLILCPKIVMRQWREEFLKFSNIDANLICLLMGSSNESINTLHNAISIYKNFVAICNYDKIVSNKLLFEKLKSWAPEILVCDESHYLKSYNSKRSKLVFELSRLSKHVYIATGTAILNNALDLFQQMKILNNGELFGSNFFAFRSKYFFDLNANKHFVGRKFPIWKMRAGALEQIKKIICEKYGDAVSVKKSECLDLPKRLTQTVHVELGEEQARIYNEMKKDFVAFLHKGAGEEGAVAYAQHAAVKALRLQQIVSGYLRDETGKVHKMPDNRRLDALEEILQKLEGQKVIVWAFFRDNIEDILNRCRQMRVNARVIHGDTKQDERDAILTEFKSSNTLNVLVANQRAMGVGVNLAEAPYCIYYSKSFSLADDAQSSERNYRSGSEVHDHVLRIDLVASNTIDEIVQKSLIEKTNLSQQILNLKDHELFKLDK